MTRSPLFRLEDVPDGGARGFELVDGEGAVQRIFAVRRGAVLHVFENSCPHRGTPLDWRPDDFLDRAGRYIVCATHGARFRIEDGVCVAGPCAGDQLAPFPVEIRDGEVRGPTGWSAPGRGGDAPPGGGGN